MIHHDYDNGRGGEDLLKKKKPKRSRTEILVGSRFGFGNFPFNFIRFHVFSTGGDSELDFQQKKMENSEGQARRALKATVGDDGA